MRQKTPAGKSDGQPCPKKHLAELLSLNGNRTFTITEKQFFGIINGWTHLELMDEKSIFESIYDSPLSEALKAERKKVINKAIGLVREREINSQNPKGWLWREESLVALLESLRGEP
jgi:hypothetical protein